MKNRDEESNDTKNGSPKILKLIFGIVVLCAGGFLLVNSAKKSPLRVSQQLESKSDQNKKVSNRNASAKGFIKGFLKGEHGGK
jgi:uncharacterized membrane protein YfcA